MNVQTINILDELKNNGEIKLSEDLSLFSCQINPAIENFIRNRAIDFARRKLSITYLVVDTYDGEILGYFALTHKAVLIPDVTMSNTSRRKLERYARLDRSTGDYMASAFLIAQFGKNYGVDNGKRISGRDLMNIANDILVNIQNQIGGGIIYLDCEDNESLKQFYTDEKFQPFGERFSDEDKQKYIQYMRFF
ncbi:MAG: GNAT family acetyltransferase [Synergistaceae bacterium]|nr:GNAT family acetyltransferase [Synergistaceae bacterium]